jgi:hypothetical protein
VVDGERPLKFPHRFYFLPISGSSCRILPWSEDVLKAFSKNNPSYTYETYTKLLREMGLIK